MSKERITCISRVDKEILKEYYIDGKTLEQIGTRVGVTRERVRQKRDKALRRLLIEILEIRSTREFSELSVRANNILERAQVTNFEQLTTMSKRELFKYRDCGLTTLKEIEKALFKKGLYFRPDSKMDEKRIKRMMYHLNAIHKIILGG